MEDILMPDQSKLLSKFYKELSTWVAFGCPIESVFNSAYGLCDNLCDWIYEEAEIHPENPIDSQCLRAELHCQLKAEFGHTNYPFNSDDAILYADENNKYTNQARLDWIAEHTPSED